MLPCRQPDMPSARYVCSANEIMGRVGAKRKAFLVCAPHNKSFIAGFAPAYCLRSCRAGTHFLVEEESVQRLIGAPFRWVPQTPPQTTKGSSLWIPHCNNAIFFRLPLTRELSSVARLRERKTKKQSKERLCRDRAVGHYSPLYQYRSTLSMRDLARERVRDTVDLFTPRLSAISVTVISRK